jgi:hypothetical protein
VVVLRTRAFSKLSESLSGIETSLPGLAGRNDDTMWTWRRPICNNVNVGRDTVLVSHVGLMLAIWLKSNIVPSEVTLKLKVIIDDLLENIFLHPVVPFV